MCFFGDFEFLHQSSNLNRHSDSVLLSLGLTPDSSSRSAIMMMVTLVDRPFRDLYRIHDHHVRRVNSLCVPEYHGSGFCVFARRATT